MTQPPMTKESQALVSSLADQRNHVLGVLEGLSFDLRGHGRSDHSSQPCDLASNSSASSAGVSLSERSMSVPPGWRAAAATASSTGVRPNSRAAWSHSGLSG